MKRSLSLVLVLALVIGMFSVFAISAGAEDTTAAPEAPTEPTTPTEPTFPEGAVAIATAEEFAAMEAGKYYYLTADITVAATYETDFTGTFDGNGHTVTTSVALFKTLKGATVKNLTLNGEVTAAADDNRAAVLAKMQVRSRLRMLSTMPTSMQAARAAMSVASLHRARPAAERRRLMKRAISPTASITVILLMFTKTPRIRILPVLPV